MAVLKGTTSPFSIKTEQQVQVNYFRRGSDRLILNPSTRVEPIQDHMFAMAVVAKVLPFLNARSKTKLKIDEITLILPENTLAFRRLCGLNGILDVKPDVYGVSSDFGTKKTIILNPQRMAMDAYGSDQANKSTFILTLLHELTHLSRGAFEEFRLNFQGWKYDTKLSVLNEGYTEVFARFMMEELFPKEFKANKDTNYDELCSIAYQIIDLTNSRFFHDVFFESDSSKKGQAIFNELCKLAPNEAHSLFRKIHKASDALDKGKDDLVKIILKETSVDLAVLEAKKKIRVAREKRQQEMANLANRAKDKCVRFMNLRSSRNYDSASLSVSLRWGDEVFTADSARSGPQVKQAQVSGKIQFENPSISINAKQIEDACGSDKKLLDAYLVKEVFAQVIGHYGGFPYLQSASPVHPLGSNNVSILNQGYPYLYAKQIMKRISPIKYFRFRKWSTPNERVAGSFDSVVGSRNVSKAFFKRDTLALYENLVKMQKKNKKKLVAAVDSARQGVSFDPAKIASLIHKGIILNYPFTESFSLQPVTVKIWDDTAWHPLTKDLQNLQAEHIGNLRVAKQKDGSLKIKGSMGFLLRPNGKIYIDKSLLDARQLKLTNVNEVIDYVISWYLNQSSIKFKLDGIEDFVLKGLGAYFYQDFVLRNNLPIVSSPQRERNAILGQKIVDALDRETAERLIFSTNSSQIRAAFENTFGKKNIEIFDKNYSFFDEPITNFAMALSVLSKKSERPTLSASQAKTTITFGEFSDGFRNNPYRASLRLITAINPGINDQIKSILATNALYLSHAVGRFRAETVALAIMSFALTNDGMLKLPSLYPASFVQTAGAAPGNQVPHFVHYAVMRNIVSNKPLFDGIENNSFLLASYKNSLAKPGTGFSYAKTAEMLKGARTDDFRNYNSILAQDAELNATIKVYMEKLCRQYSSKVFSDLYSRPRFKEAYNGYLEQMLTDFVLGMSRAMQPDILELKNSKIIGGVIHVEAAEGVFVPIMHPKNFESGPGQTIASALAFSNAFASMLSKGAKFGHNTIICDISGFRNSATDLWIKNVLADTSTMHTFFDIANRGSESCASRFFVSL
ncbi:MAG: hypothetical protein WC506_04070 [Candidatus Micrarchaeia archaeon]